MKGMDMLVFAGQSNMQGVSEKLSESALVRGGVEYRFLEDRLVPLSNPVGENITYDMQEGEDVSLQATDEQIEEWLANHALGRANWGYTNMVPSFCRAYIKETGRSVIAVHAAKGSTSISDWQEGTPLYNALLAKVRSAIHKVEMVGLGKLYFIWLQGENDAILGRAQEEYLSLLTSLKNSLKENLPLERFALIRVGNFTMDDRDIAIQAAQDEACRRDRDFYMLTREMATYSRTEKYVNLERRGHLNALGLENIGKIAGKELGRLTNKIGGK